jgi:hypothetical protein
MQVSLPGYQLPVAHSFAVISSFSKRLKLMKTHRTKLKTTLLSIVAISLFSFGIIGWSSLKGQEEVITGRTESFEKAQTRFKSMIPLLISNKLTPKHQKIMEVIKAENPDKEIRFQYYKESSFKSYYDNFIPQRHPLFTPIMSQSDKEALTRIYLTDSTIINMSENIGMGSDDFTFKYSDFTPDVSDAIKNNVNYIMIYEYIDKPTVYNDSEILNLEEVDQAPIVMGGIENLAKTIALDIKVPEHLDRNKLPENIEFEFVVQGGKSITHINLLNNLKGSDKKNKAYYQFFREVHDDFRMKISSIYPWKRGIKDGKEVLVRMKISIPTKYML